MITPCETRDLTALARMLHELGELTGAPPAALAEGGGPAALRAVFTEALARDASVLVYRTEGLARGYLMWRPLPGAAGSPRRMALLEQLFVDPVWRRRGLARRLLARCEADLRAAGFTGWTAPVPEASTASRAWMRAAGAERSGPVCEKALG
jgi:GNAT superfamily N-acetyltransferase